MPQGRTWRGVHSGDPSLYGAIGEQMRRLDAGRHRLRDRPRSPRPSPRAAASLKAELTLPGVSQSVVLDADRHEGLRHAERRNFWRPLAGPARRLAIHLSVRNVRHVVDSLVPH